MVTRIVNVILRGQNQLSPSLAAAATSANQTNTALRATSTSARDADRSINTLTGRLSLLANVAATVGPALVPIGAVGIQAVAGLANQLGAAAIAGGTAILAFQGVGDTLEAVNKAQLEPTADNLNAAREAMANLSPAAADLVTQLQDLRPTLEGLTDISATGLFPGVGDLLDDLMTRLPDAERILTAVSTTMGDLAADLGDGLASDDLDDFFDFLATEVPPTLDDLGRTVGNLAQGLAELWMAFDPLNDDFSAGLLDAARGFNEWADGLSRTEGFQDFIAYVRENGPRVVDALASIGNAAVQIVTALAPLGEGSLEGITLFSDVIATIAASDFGTPIAVAAAALSALNLAMGAYAAVAGSAVAGAAGQALIAYFGTGLVGAMGMASAAATALGATMAVALPVGAALLVGHLDDVQFSAREMEAGLNGLALGDVNDQLSNLTFSADSLGDALHNAAFDELSPWFGSADEIEDLDSALADLAATAPGKAGRAFETIREEAEAAGLTIDDLMRLFPEYRLALEQMGAPVPGDFGNNLIKGVVGALEGATDAADDAAEATERFSTALAEVMGFFDRRAAFRGYQEALDDLTTSVQENGRSLDRHSPKGRAVEAALDGVATSAAKVAEHLNETNRARFMTRAERDIRTRAAQLGLPREAVQRLIAKLHELDGTKADPKVDADTREALRKIGVTDEAIDKLDRAQAEALLKAKDNASGVINGVRVNLNSLDGDSATVRVYHETINRVRNEVSTFFSQFGKKSATGGPIIGPGTATSDDVPIWASNGEYMVRAAAVDHYGRAFFDQVNALAYARGGLVAHSGPAPAPAPASRSSAAGPSRSLTFGDLYAVDPRALLRDIEQRERDANALMSSA